MVTDAEIAEARARTRRSGFRRGFFAVMIPVCLVIVVYLAGPIIGDRVPALAPVAEALVGYGDRLQAAMVDGLRLMADRIRDLG